MKYDWLLALSEQENENIRKISGLEEEIKKLKGQKKKEKFEELEKEHAKLLFHNPHLLYYLFVTKDETLADHFRSTWQKENLDVDLRQNLIQWDLNEFVENNFLRPQIDLALLPPLSFFIRFTFTLEKPYISCDEKIFYIIDNPIRKDKVLGLSYVAPSAWKGSLKATLRHLGYKDDDCIHRIFGNQKHTEQQEELKAGRLRIFPTFFGKKDLEVINPHDRKTRVGIKPILIETVPEDSSGVFTLLYAPFNLMEKKRELKKEVSKDILIIAKALKAMFRDYGFGAKTSSGYGIAKSTLSDGRIVLKAKGMKYIQEKKSKLNLPEESFKKYLNEDGTVKDQFKGTGEMGLLSNTEYTKRGQELGGGSLSEFKKFRRWYQTRGKEWQDYIQSKSVPAKWPTWEFSNFNELMNKTEEIIKILENLTDYTEL